MEYTHHHDSPLGGILLTSDGSALTGLWFDGQKNYAGFLDAGHKEELLPAFITAERWLDVYFSGRCPDFMPPLKMKGTEFQKAVWSILLTIPYGATMTYGEIASKMAPRNGLSKMSAQAIGGAVGHNPISLIIPCHRVIGADGSLRGYAGGVEKKLWLLELEKAASASLLY